MEDENERAKNDDHNEEEKKPRTVHTLEKRRLCAPEIVFLNAFVHLKLQKRIHEHNDEEEDTDTDIALTLVDILFSASDALEVGCLSFFFEPRESRP